MGHVPYHLLQRLLYPWEEASSNEITIADMIVHLQRRSISLPNKFVHVRNSVTDVSSRTTQSTERRICWIRTDPSVLNGGTTEPVTLRSRRMILRLCGWVHHIFQYGKCERDNSTIDH